MSELLVIIDPLSQLNPKSDTGLALCEAAHRRGHRVFVARTKDLLLRDGVAWVHCRELQFLSIGRSACSPNLSVTQRECYHFELNDSPPTPRELSSFGAIFMRRDPPMDLDYLFATQILDRAETLVLNAPEGLRRCNEKLYALEFSEWMPPSLVSQCTDTLRDFVGQHAEAVLKLLDGKGGEAVLMARREDRGLRAQLEMMTQRGRRFVMAQRFVPEALEGDKRLLLLDGKLEGVFKRVPSQDDFRGNIAAGAKVVRASANARELEICRALGPRLVRDGLIFVGLDILGPYLSEINVTSPTGVRQVQALDGIDIASMLIEWSEQHLHRPLLCAPRGLEA
ncbi:MAG: glutathione synthase [Myxococcota bacterium]|jgi:glutathione synthase|nr:glutathione synthase [Myxococcota bacterium]